MDDMARRLRCSKATLYSANNKEPPVIALTKHFFRQATDEIETAVAALLTPADGAPPTWPPWGRR